MDKRQKYGIIHAAIDELSGTAFQNQQEYNDTDKRFYKERFCEIIDLLPEIKSNSVGLEVGLCGGILALAIRRIYNLGALNTLEHPVTTKLYTKKFNEILKKEKIINKPVDIHAQKLPWPENYFDFLIFSEVAEHLIPSDIPNILNEFRRILKKNGWLFITTPNISSLLKRINLLRGKNPIEFDVSIHEGATYGHIREYTLDEILLLTTKAKFNTMKRGYYMIDRNRNIYTQIEYLSYLLYPPLGNNIIVLVRK